MTFLHPALLATAGGLALLPLVVHLLSRRGYQSQPWAAMMFLATAQQAVKRRLRVERWLLLVVRTLIVIVLGVAIARPLASGSALGDAIARPRFDRVIVIDDSLSMQAEHSDGTTSFDAAKALARRIMDGCEPRDGLALVAASSPRRSWMDQPMHDRQALRGILDGWNCSWATDDVPGALRLASELLVRGEAAPGCRLVYLLTDRTRSSIESSAATSAPAGVEETWPGIDRIFVLDVGPSSRENVAIRSLSAASPIVGVGVPARFNVRIVNHCARRVEQVKCDVMLDGAVAQSRAVGPLDPYGEASEEFELVFNSDGPHRVAAQIKGESNGALPADDVRYLGIQVASGLSILAVEGSDDSRKAARELFYYSVAVSSPSTRAGQTGIRVKCVTPLDLEAEILGDYSVLVLGNMRKLPDEAWRRIDRFVRGGGGLLVVLGDRIQADHYNDVAARVAGLLPFRLEEAKTAPETTEPWGVRIDEPRHLALTDLVDADRGGLGVAQVRAFWKIRPSSGPQPPRIPMSLSNGDPLLIQSDVGQGRVLAWLTSANMAWNNLPAKPDYVPLMLNVTLYAAGIDRSAGDLSIMQPIVHVGAATETRQAGAVQRPDGESVKVDWTPSEDASALVYRQTDRPGFYIVTAGRDRSFAAVNADPRESDLTIADEMAVRRCLGPIAKIVVEPGDVVAELGVRPPREAAPFFMVLLLALVSTETILTTLFGGRT